MIVYGLLELLVAFLRVVFLPIRMIAFPAQFSGMILQIIGYIAQGARVMKTFCDWSYISLLLAFIISMNAFVAGYSLIMWVLRKIPLLNID